MEMKRPISGQKKLKVKDSSSSTTSPSKQTKVEINKKQASRKRVNADESPFDQPRKKFKKDKVFVDGPLRNDELVAGVVVLACVRKVHPHSIVISLPGNLNGTIPVTNVSDDYSKLLSHLSMARELQENEIISSITDLFKPGLFIPVIVKSVKEHKGNKKKSIVCSCKPTDVNNGVPKSGVYNDMLLFGNVSSVEDHGYRIDTGIKGLVAFLKNADSEDYVEKHCSGKKLCVGTPLWCVAVINDKKSADNKETRVINVIIDPNRIESAKQPSKIQMNSLLPGMKIVSHIKTVGEQGLVVTFGSFEGSIHSSHLPSDSKSYSAGSIIEASVLYVHPVSKDIQLTALDRIVKHNGCATGDLAGIEVRDIMQAKIVQQVKKLGLYLRLPKKRKGFAALSHILDGVDVPDLNNFKVGEIVDCRVLGFNFMENLVLVTLKKSILKEKFITVKNLKPGDFVELSKPVKVKKKKSEDKERVDFAIGMISQAKIIAINNGSYKVTLKSNKQKAFLPFDHLSDYPDLQMMRRYSLKKGNILPKVTFFSQKKHCTVTMKESFIKGAEEQLFADTFEDLEVGMVLPAIVKNHQDYGFFVELAGGYTGLCPLKSSTVQPSKLKQHYPNTRSVITKIIKIDKEKSRFLGSVSKVDCVQKSDHDPVKSLQDYLQHRKDISNELTDKIDELKPYFESDVGSVVEVTVTAIHEKGILGELSGGVKVIATHEHLGGTKPEIGQKYPAVVLDVDLLSPCLEVTLDSKLCKSIQSRVENVSSKVKVGQSMKGLLLLLKNEYLLMKLKGHGLGKLVYVPAKQHFNDPNLPSQHKIGMYSNIIIKENDGLLIGVLKMKGDKASGSNPDEKENIDTRNLPLHPIQVGDIIEAKVKTVYPLQMNILADNIHGRVHITEVSDDIQGRKNPLNAYHGGDSVKVKVIGLRTMESKKGSYMPITQPRASRTLLECTLKQSKMDITDPKQLISDELSTFIGAEMTVFIIKVDDNKVWVQASLNHQGSISFFHVSKNPDVINNINKHFKVGHAVKATVVGKTDNDKITFSLIGEEQKLEIGNDVIALVTGTKKAEVLSLRLPNGSQGLVETTETYSLGTYIKCKITSLVKTGIYKLSLLQSRKDRKRKSSLCDNNENKIGKRERKDSLKSDDDKEDDGKEDEEITLVKVVPKLSSEKRVKVESAGKSRLTVDGFAWGGELDIKQTSKDEPEDDDDDDTDIIGAVTNQLKRKRKRDQEKMIEEYEKQQLEGTTGPQSVNDFERLVLQSPNSSMVWLGYMAYHLELGEVPKARIVAEKALNTIVFREEQEKKNVWLAYLNLEAMYGDSEDLKDLLQRAITYNDPLEIQLKMCDIYVGANKIEDAEQQYMVLIKKFKKEKSVWKSYAQFLYKQDKQETARNVLKRCLTALEKRDHVEVISRFANLEFSNGNPERGRTMFENLIASYPSRTDIWSVYVDMVVKAGDIAGARQLLERAAKQKLNTKKLSFLIQKFIKFEETHGTEEEVQKVKDMAVTLFDT